MSAPCPLESAALPTLLTSRPQAQQKGSKGAEKKGAVPRTGMKLPEAYSMPVCVRNTFIDTSAERSPSLERFYREREVSTCPSAHIGRLKGLFQEADADCWGATDETDTQLPSEPPETRSVSEASPSNAAAPSAFVISLADAIGRPRPPPQARATGGDVSAGLPSVGSAGHAAGACKPCAFFHTVGCSNGTNCEFCHLCDTEERKRRRKAKYEARRAAKLRQGRLAACGED